MSDRHKQLILGASISGVGAHPGATGTAQHLTDIAYYRKLLQTAEHGLFDFVLLHDERALPSEYAYGRLDALSVFARLAPETHSVGLAISKPTTYSEPFTVSRELATLDLVSAGRAAWNVTTIASDDEAQNYGELHAMEASNRRALAEEFVAVSRKLWDSWEDNAVITDVARGLYLDPNKLHHINHVGPHFRIRGPQITYRPPQGQVVIIQVDQGDTGAPLSAAVADVLVLHHESLVAAQLAYTHHQREAAQLGREIRVLQSILPILGATTHLAQERADELDALARQRGQALPRAKVVVGTPTQVADLLEAWFAASAADGFYLLPAVLPDGLDEISSTLVPELQRRGLFRSTYAGHTLREHLRLQRPESQYAGTTSEAHTAYHLEGELV